MNIIGQLAIFMSSIDAFLKAMNKIFVGTNFGGGLDFFINVWKFVQLKRVL